MFPSRIAKLIKNWKILTSAGVHDIISKILNNSNKVFKIKKMLCLPLSQSLSTGVLPEDMKVGDVVSVFRNGDHHYAFNNRLNSVTFVV